MEQQTMGKRIAQLRKEKGYTQEQLAELVGVSAQAVSKWENDASCPDISILPKIGEVLGVSTDELLGVKPLEPRVVIVDGNGKAKDKGARSPYAWRFDMGTDGIWFAAAIILLGAAFLLEKLNVLSVNVWGVIWPAVLLGLGVSWCVKRFSFIGLGVGLLGLYYLLYNLGAIEFRLTWNYIWPIAIILFGLSILMDKLLPKRAKCGQKLVSGDGEHEPVCEYDENDGFLHCDCSFGESTHKFEGTELAGGDVDISFGKGVFDFSQVTSLRTGAKLDVDVSFGSLELIVPRSIRLKPATDKAFGSTTTRGEADPDATMVLPVKADVSFATMTIRYI